MSDGTADDLKGVVARFEELVAARPRGAGRSLGAVKARSRQLGGHRSMFRGQGMEFDEVRAYQMGDDIRTIDWRVTARTGRTHTKLFQEERERPVLILLDARSFMRFGSRDSFKSVLAAKTAAMLSFLSLEEGDRVGGVVMMPSGIASYPPQRSHGRVLRFIKAMADATGQGFGAPPPPSEPTLADALARLRHVSRPGTLAFIISDFHDFDEASVRELGRLSLHCRVSNLFIHDALEAEAPQGGLYRVSDGRGVAMFDGDNRTTRNAYARRFAARRQAVEQLSRQRGMAFLPLQTGEDPADILNPARGRQGGVL